MALHEDLLDEPAGHGPAGHGADPTGAAPAVRSDPRLWAPLAAIALVLGAVLVTTGGSSSAPDAAVWRLDGRSWMVVAVDAATVRAGAPDPARLTVAVHDGPPGPTTGDPAALAARRTAARLARAVAGRGVAVAGLGDLEGPSAGLALTLAAADAARGERWSGGLAVAATGTVDADGSVGAVGAVPAKVAAARRAGADVVFVPGAPVGAARLRAAGARWAAGDGATAVVAVGAVTDPLWWLCGATGRPAVCAAAARGDDAQGRPW